MNVVDSTIDPAVGVEEFLHKWRARWPEWGIARIFVADAQRPLAEAWFALLQEWTDAAWAGDEAAPGLAKLGWWQEELQGWNKGARRHPLGLSLHKQAAPWARLSAALPALHALREAAHDLDASESMLARGHVLAAIVMECERALFVTGPDRVIGDGMSGSAAHARARMLFAQCLWQRGPGVNAAAMTACARALLASPVAHHGPRPCRVHAALIRARIRRIAAGGRPAPVPPPTALWSAWRAARIAED